MCHNILLSFSAFTTQISSIIITVVTFTVYYFIDSNSKLTATNVFAGLAFFNQLTVPLLILPVTVLMVIQAMVRTAINIHEWKIDVSALTS